VSGSRPTFATNASGISDMTLIGRYWVGNPDTRQTSNISVGLGVKAPTGNDRAEDAFLDSVDPKTGVRKYTVKPVDQSIQPGDGGWGIVADFTAFKAFGKIVGYASGYYLANPREQNDFLRDPTTVNPDPLTAYLSISDQFAARAGVNTSFKKLGVSLGARMEGVPSSDLIGGDLGRRRPGYSIAVEPGLYYSFKRSALSFSLPFLVYRNRTQSYSDKIQTEKTGKHVQGDAAYADVVVIAGYSIRF